MLFALRGLIPKVAASVGAGSEDAGLATYTEDKSDGGLSLRNAVGTGTTSRDAQEVWKPTPRTASNTQVQLEGRSMSVDWSAGEAPAASADMSDHVVNFAWKDHPAARGVHFKRKTGC